MATTTPRSKSAREAKSSRGPRRTPVVAPDRDGQGPDLERLRADLYAAILAEHGGADLEPVERAFDLAIVAHEGQRRATGEPFVTHPIASAQILAELGLDTTAIQAALLHDVPEDTELSLTDVEDQFGPEVAQLVDGVTKLSKFSTHSHEQQQAENIRKMLLAMAQDIRVVLIKLADRLHNMRTLYALPSDKQQRIARQTMEIYAPLAERLGIWQMKWELEDLAFKALEPERFRELAKLLDTRRKGRETYIERAIAELRPKLEAAGIKADIEGRPKHIYSIWKKMQRKGAEFGEIYDVYAIRLLVDEVRVCYAALGIVHSISPIPGQFTTTSPSPEQPLPVAPPGVIAIDGKPSRSDPDPPDAPGQRVGIAAHWRYKEDQSPTAVRRQARLAAPTMEWQRRVRSDATEFVRASNSTSSGRSSCSPRRVTSGPARERHAAGLRVPDPHRRRPPHGRRKSTTGWCRSTTGSKWRHRRGRDDQGRARPVARLAERRPDQLRPRKIRRG
jgi:GTP pyrophosphokinase